MLLVEIILIIILASFVLGGVKSGFFLTLGRLLGAVVGFVIARATYAWVGGLLALIMPGHAGIASFLAFLFIFILVDRLIGLVFHLLSHLFNLATFIPFTKTIGRILGGILGFFEGVVLVGSCVYLILRFHLDPSLMAWVSSSTVALYTERVFRAVLGFLL